MNRQVSPTSLTGLPLADVDVYLVRASIVAQGRRSYYWAERDESRANRADTIADICNAQIDDVAQVIKFNAATFSSEDVTEEIAREVMAADLDNRQGISEHLYEFLSNTLGFSVVHAAIREDA